MVVDVGSILQFHTHKSRLPQKCNNQWYILICILKEKVYQNLRIFEIVIDNYMIFIACHLVLYNIYSYTSTVFWNNMW